MRPHQGPFFPGWATTRTTNDSGSIGEVQWYIKVLRQTTHGRAVA